MKKLYKFLASFAALCAALFACSIVVYLFNLDLRLIAKLQPMLESVYDRVERTPMP